MANGLRDARDRKWDELKDASAELGEAVANLSYLRSCLEGARSRGLGPAAEGLEKLIEPIESGYNKALDARNVAASEYKEAHNAWVNSRLQGGDDAPAAS